MSELKAAPNGLEGPIAESSFATQHRREHRPGPPSKIDCDAEPRTFILERIDVMTFPELAVAVADNFPPKRRASKSTINSWWNKNGRPSGKTHPR